MVSYVWRSEQVINWPYQGGHQDWITKSLREEGSQRLKPKGPDEEGSQRLKSWISSRGKVPARLNLSSAQIHRWLGNEGITEWAMPKALANNEPASAKWGVGIEMGRVLKWYRIMGRGIGEIKGLKKGVQNGLDPRRTRPTGRNYQSILDIMYSIRAKSS